MALPFLALVLFLVSSLFSMLGLGGGILYVPILLAAGHSMHEAPALSLMLIVATSGTALVTFLRKHRVDWKLALLMDPPTDLAALAGGYLSASTPERLLKALLAGILFVAGILMLSRAPGSARNVSLAGNDRAAGATGHTGPKPNPQNAPVSRQSRPWHWHRRFRGVEYAVNVPLVLFATASIGLLSGMVGVTGGIIKLPIMVLLCGVPMEIAVGTSTVMVAATAAFGLTGHALSHPLPWGAGAALAGAAVAGGLIGSRLSISAPRALLRRAFGLVLLGVGLKVLIGLVG